jgi:hypothetical protein
MARHKFIVPPVNIKDEFSTLFWNENLSLKYPPIAPTHAVNPVYGLHAPVATCQMCDHCSKIYKGTPPNSFLKHVCQPQHKNPPSRTYTLTAAQSFDKNNTKYPLFAVLNTPVPSLPLGRWQIYQSQSTPTPRAPEEMSVPDNYHTIHQFLHKEGWISYVEGKDLEKLTSLVSPRNADILLPNLARHIEAYLTHYQARITTGNTYHVQRLVSTRPR